MLNGTVQIGEFKSAPALLNPTKRPQWRHSQGLMLTARGGYFVRNAFKSRQAFLRVDTSRLHLRREESGKKIESSTFSTAGYGNRKWCVELYPNGLSEEAKEFLSLYLRLVSCDDDVKSVLGEYKLAIIGKGGRKDNVRIECARFDLGSFWGWEEFIQRECLLRSTDDLVTNDKLTIYCEVLAFVDSVNISPPKISMAANVPDCRLSQDLGRLLESRRFCDVILSASGREMHAHKGILAARSPVFAAMFEQEMKEKKQGRVEITDFDFDVLHEVVEFIYTGRAPKLNEMAEEVLAATDKYDLGRLKAMCEGILCSKLSVGTAAEMLALADMHSADKLKANAFWFVIDSAIYVMKTDGWKLMASEKPHLLSEVCRALSVQNEVLKTILGSE